LSVKELSLACGTAWRGGRQSRQNFILNLSALAIKGGQRMYNFGKSVGAF